jgi:UDP-2,3-diacylglucosamine hydrolase
MRQPMSQPTLIVSDLHLGAVPEAVRDAFVRFTRRWHGQLDTLLINGDLFDFWFEYRTVVPNAHFHTLRALADLRESGVRIILIGGNHDAWGGPFLRDTIGVELAHESLELDIAGRRAFVAHGDGLGPGDIGYKMLKRLLRNRAVWGAMRWVHPDFAGRIARRVSRTGDGTGERFRRARERAKILEDYAVKLLEEREDLELVVFGHCHQPQLQAVGRRRYYVNSGDWVTHRTYTVVTPESIEQKEWMD